MQVSGVVRSWPRVLRLSIVGLLGVVALVVFPAGAASADVGGVDDYGWTCDQTGGIVISLPEVTWTPTFVPPEYGPPPYEKVTDTVIVFQRRNGALQMYKAIVGQVYADADGTVTEWKERFTNLPLDDWWFPAPAGEYAVAHVLQWGFNTDNFTFASESVTTGTAFCSIPK